MVLTHTHAHTQYSCITYMRSLGPACCLHHTFHCACGVCVCVFPGHWPANMETYGTVNHLTALNPTIHCGIDSLSLSPGHIGTKPLTPGIVSWPNPLHAYFICQLVVRVIAHSLSTFLFLETRAQPLSHVHHNYFTLA